MSKPLYIHLSPMPKAFVDGVGICLKYSRQSQWFGEPMMPKDVEMPTQPNPSYCVPYVSAWDGRTVSYPERIPLPFICQIDCREIPGEVGDLPHDGELYFFADLDYYAHRGGEPMPMYAAKDYVGVVYVPEEEFERVLERDSAGGSGDSRTSHIYLAHEMLRDDATVYGEPRRITLNFERPTGEEPDNQLLGEPEHREWEDWDEPYAGWRLLFQMDSCDLGKLHFNFMDWGVFNILIDPEDLRRRDFSKAVGIILST